MQLTPVQLSAQKEKLLLTKVTNMPDKALPCLCTILCMLVIKLTLACQCSCIDWWMVLGASVIHARGLLVMPLIEENQRKTAKKARQCHKHSYLLRHSGLLTRRGQGRLLSA